MAGRFGRSFYRFSSVNRPLAPAANPSAQDSAQYDGRQYPSAARHTSPEPRLRSPTRESLPASHTYSVKKAISPPYSPPYEAPAPRTFASPPESVDKYPKSPEAEPKAMTYKTKAVGKSDRDVETGKSKTASSSQKQLPNAINIKGENVGAVMEIVESKKRDGGHTAGAAQKSTSSPPAPPTTNFINTNFQSVNNSLLYNASLAHRDPGLHLAFSRNPTADRSKADK